MLPHRYPFLLLDRIVDYEIDVYVKALKNVTVNEPFFEGHFPSQPVMPGVLILEAMAQSCGVLTSITLGKSLAKDGIYLFVGIDKARFKRPVVPGDQLILKSTISRKLRGIWKFSSEATVDGELCCNADLMCTYQETDK